MVLETKQLEFGLTIKKLIGHTHIVFSLAVHPDRTLVSASGDKTIRIWNVNSGLTIDTIPIDTFYLSTLALLPDATFVIGFDDKIKRFV